MNTPTHSHRWLEEDKARFRQLVAVGYADNWTSAIRKATREALEELQKDASAIHISEEPAP
jgi:uncharacterized protein YbjQ (UPF0145 family)